MTEDLGISGSCPVLGQEVGYARAREAQVSLYVH